MRVPGFVLVPLAVLSVAMAAPRRSASDPSQFGSPLRIDAGYVWGSETVQADVDGNGLLDYIEVANQVGPLALVVHLDLGDDRIVTGRYTTPYSVESGTSQVEIALIEDLTADDRPEILLLVSRLYACLEHLPILMVNAGDGSFPRGQLIPTFWNVRRIIVADLGNDDREDLLFDTIDDQCAPGDNRMLFAVRNRGDGGFDPPLRTTPEAGTPLAVGDVDYDGRNDLVVGTTYYPNVGEAEFAAPRALSLPPDAVALDVRDVSGDAIDDVVAVTPSSFIGLVNRGNATFVETTHGGGGGELVAVAGAQGPHYIVGGSRLFLNDGTGRFSLASTWPGRHPAVTTDLDADGRDDIVCVDADTLTILRAQPGGGFAARQFVPGSVFPMVLHDFDADGLQDIGLRTTASAHILLNRGGDFDATVYATGSTQPWVLQDLDRDGLTDIVLVLSGKLRVLSSSTPGAFLYSREYFLRAAEYQRVGRVMDHNGDGLLDLVVAISGSWYVMWQKPAPTPVEVHDMQASQDERGVLLSWRLDAGRESLQGVHVQRSVSAAGTYETLTPSLLEPRATMSFVDVEAGEGRLWYRLALLFAAGATNHVGPVEVLVTGRRWHTGLETPRTGTGGQIEISYRVGVTGPLRLEVFDVAGRRIRTLVSTLGIPGAYRETWDRQDATGAPVPRGIYLVRLLAADARPTRKLTLLH